MTTLTLNGYRIIDRAGTANDSFSRVQVQLGVSTGFKLGYSVVSSELGVHSVTLTGNGNLHSISANGVALAEGYEMFVVYPQVNGKTSAFLVIARDMTETTDDTTDLEMTYIQIGGTAAPNFRSLSAFSTWFQARDLLDTPPSIPSGPDRQIDLTKIANFVGTSQADRYQLLPDWGSVTVSTEGGDDVVTGSDLANAIRLGIGNDRADGAMGNDTILGEAGNDRLLGGRGNDDLDGGAGRDTLVGGWGNDVLTGGIGSDRFVFEDIRGSDTITDFEDGVDRIDLRAFGFTAGNIASAMTEVDGDVRIDLGAETVLLVENTTIAALQNDLIL